MRNKRIKEEEKQEEMKLSVVLPSSSLTPPLGGFRMYDLVLLSAASAVCLKSYLK